MKCSELCKCRGTCCNGKTVVLQTTDDFITEETSDDEVGFE